LDVAGAEKNLSELTELKEQRVKALLEVMPPHKKITKKSRPKVCYKKDGSLSSRGEDWFRLLSERGLPESYDGEVEVENGSEEPNPSSPHQVKDWLLSLGWQPATFKQGANGLVPQVKDGDELCQSVKALIPENPAVEHLEKMGVLGHRIGLLKGFLREQKNGYITQGAHGFTSTLRLRHRGIVNLPKVSAEWGGYIRGVLTCDEGYEVCGSDLASLEDRVKQHFIYPLDPNYVKTMMAPDYDSHLALAVFAGGLTQAQADAHKRKEEDHSGVRHIYKQVNYQAQYGVGAKKLSAYLRIPVAQANKLLGSYRRLNWAAPAISQTWEVKEALGRKWIKNPINNFWYELRNEKDKFSAVCQGGGSFIFDLWIKFILEQREDLVNQVHDEIAVIIKKGHREAMTQILQTAIDKVNKMLKLNRDMGIEVKFGNNYGETH
jgi:hypothetical protein